MRNVALAIACFATVGFVVPAVSASAQDREVVRTDHGHDHDWRHPHHKKVVVIKHRHRDHDHDHD
jgi:hypothetical protein